jgi:DNA polymerase-3 subunit delta'
METLPWHEAAWRQLESAWRERRWPHALLVYGAVGVGKRDFALRIARTVLCDRNAAFSACGECAACKLIAAGTHPDLLTIAPEEDKQQISVDQVRESCSQLAMTSYRQGYKVAMIEPAEQMTLAAANSLLKTLEEPARNTMLILIAARHGALLPTLRSRCQQLPLRVPRESVALDWLRGKTGKEFPAEVLRLAGGAPLRALAMLEEQQALWTELKQDIDALLAGRHDVTQIAKRWGDESLNERIVLLDRWLADTIRQRIAQTDDPITGTPLPSTAGQLNISRLYACLDRARALRAQLSRTALQRELAADMLLIDLSEALSARRA